MEMLTGIGPQALRVNVSGNGKEMLAKEGHTQAPSCSHSSYSPAKAILMAPLYLLKEALGLMTGTKRLSEL